ncbi:MAG: FAD-binding protein [Candidatus Poseidoniaceae archaeon]|nr:FAD-binding protein [Candidatus Poseidoniaceae archaeon]
MEVWDVVVLGDGPAGLAAAANAASEGANVLLMTAEALGRRDPRMSDGLAAAIDESTNRGHREDTIRAGGFLCDQDIVASVTSSAVRETDLLERRGVIFRRDLRGLPHVRRLPGHGQPRVVGSGDADARELQQVMEEQCMRHGVVRRSDQVPLRLVHTGQRVQGLVVADLTGGRVLGLQSKAVILADEGASNVATTGRGAYGLALALDAGLPLRDMEFLASTPLGVRDASMTLPLGLLADGATVCESDGTPIELGDDLASAVNAIRTAKEAVIDLRDLGEARPWYDATFRLLSQRLGIDADRQTVAIEARAYASLGGVAVDEEGRAVIGSWSRWFTGLYAAGGTACTGLHGAGLLPGNLVLDALTSGRAAGASAAAWLVDQPHAGSKAVAGAVEEAEADLAAMMAPAESEGGVVRTGAVTSAVSALISSTFDGGTSADELESALAQIETLALAAEALHLDDTSLVANANFEAALAAQHGVQVARAMLQSALVRTESRGVHVRHDHPDTDAEQMHHTLISADGTTDTLAVRKGVSGHWVLAPAESA